MTQQSFVSRRKTFWDDYEKLIRGGKKAFREKASLFPKCYRELTQDLNTARAHGFDPSIIDRLNALVLEGNQILYSSRSFSFRRVAYFMLRTFPGTVRSQWRSLCVAMLLFYGISVFMFFLCLKFPETAVDIMGYRQTWSLEEMYNPESEYYLSPRNVSSDADMFGYYIYNNISIAFQTFAGGILAGFGSLLILCSNALFLGTAAGHIVNKGFGQTFFSFIIAHSALELNAIVLSAQAGLIMGYRLFFTRGLSRSASLREAGKTALPVITGAAIMLFMAACLEAFWSSRHELPAVIRFGSGALCWVLTALYFVFTGKTSGRNK